METLMTPADVDRIFCYPNGRAARLAREGRIPYVRLPDGEIRFTEEVISSLIHQCEESAIVDNHSPSRTARSKRKNSHD